MVLDELELESFSRLPFPPPTVAMEEGWGRVGYCLEPPGRKPLDRFTGQAVDGCPGTMLNRGIFTGA